MIELAIVSLFGGCCVALLSSVVFGRKPYKLLAIGIEAVSFSLMFFIGELVLRLVK
jgi:hypothetical protein